MPRVNHVRSSFLAGEISEKSWGRTDLPQYNHSFEELKNMIVMPQGGSTRRPGTRWMKQVEGNKKCVTIPFIFSNDESYVLELTESSMRIVNNNTFFVSTPIAGLGGPFVFSAAILDEIQFCQSADVLFLVHESFLPLAIARTAVNSFTAQVYTTFNSALHNEGDFASRPWRSPNTNSAHTFSPSATSGIGINMVSSINWFVAGMVGSKYKLTQIQAGLLTTGVFTIVSITSPMVAVVNVDLNFVNTTASSDWEEEAWSSFRGRPGTICLHQGRLGYGGNTSQPDTMWFSKSENFFNLDGRGMATNTAAFPSQTNASAFQRTLASSRVNRIQWMSPGKTLAVGTIGGEVIVLAPDQALSLGTENFVAEAETFHGSRKAMALRIAYVVVFIQRSKSRLRELTFDFNSDSYVATDISHLGEHLANRKKLLAHQEFPNSVIWALSDFGQLDGITRDQQQQITAWHTHELGGQSGVGIAPIIESMCVVPTQGIPSSSAGGSRDRLWMCVQRTINGVTQFYLEYMTEEYAFDSYVPFFDAWYQDCSKFATAAATVTWPGFSHLAGETVSVFATTSVGGSAYLGELLVSAGGVITTPVLCVAILAGYSYESRVKPTMMEGGSGIGSAMGAIKRADKSNIRFVRTGGAKVGTNDDNLIDLIFRDYDLPESAPFPLFTGDKFVDLPNGYDREGQMLIVNDSVFPMTISSISERFMVNDV